MIIIAGAVILSLSSSSIVNKAKESVEKANLQSVQDAASLAYSDYKLNGKTSNLSEYIKNWLIDKNYISENNAGKYVFDETGKVLSRNGLQEITLSGTNISQSNTYNDSAFLRIYGKSEQQGTPSPDSPIQISSIENFNLVSTGKNLFGNFNSFTNFKNLSVFTKAIYGNEGYSTPGLTFANNTIKITGPNSRLSLRFGKLKPNTKYTFSCSSSEFTGRIYALFGDSFYYTSFPFGRYKHTFTTDSYGNNNTNGTSNDKNQFQVAGALITIPESGITLSNFQLEEGPTATPYEPYKSNTINFPYTLRSLPDGTKDYIEIDNVNKTARLYRNIGVVIYGGDEGWATSGDSGYFTGYYGYTLIKNDAKKATRPLCTHFETGTEQQKDRVFFANTNNAYNFRFTVFEINSLSNFKTWLSSNPVTIHYQLANPTIEDLNYEEVKTYYQYTNIYTNSTVQPTLEAKIRVSN